MKLQEPLENKPTSGKPDTGGAFESSLCKPAAKIMMESNASIPATIRIIFPVFPTITLPTIPAMPAMTMRVKAAQPYQSSIVTVCDAPIAEDDVWYGYTETSALILIPMASADIVIVHQGNAKLMNAIMPATIPM